MDEAVKDTSTWKGILCLWVGRPNIITTTALHKAIYRFNEIPTKIPATFLQKQKNLS